MKKYKAMFWKLYQNTIVNNPQNGEYFCIDCAKQLECWGSDIKLDDPDLCIPINCIDYQDMDELFNS
mgnify:CR=1 FL=1